MTTDFLVAAMLLSTGIALLVAIRAGLRDDRRRGQRDQGQVLVAFGQAFPNRAIRQAIQTEDGHTTFLRLADEGIGVFQEDEGGVVTGVLCPHDVIVEETDGDRTLALRSSSPHFRGGSYRFADHRDAAEVCLWICSLFASVIDGQTIIPDRASRMLLRPRRQAERSHDDGDHSA